jgi:hypothetical protein
MSEDEPGLHEQKPKLDVSMGNSEPRPELQRERGSGAEADSVLQMNLGEGKIQEHAVS